MEDHTLQPSCSTQLGSRTLWFDGSSTWNPDILDSTPAKISAIRYVTHLTPTIKQYNRFAPVSKKISVKLGSLPLAPFEWNIPTSFKNLDVADYAAESHAILTSHITDEQELRQREKRLVQELILFKDMGFYDVLRGVIWLINNLSKNNVVWGIGRGSSVASYLLYVLGVHDVDSFAFQLDVADFLHE